MWLRGNPRARVLALGPMTLRVRADVRVRLRALCAVYARHTSASERMRARHTSASKCIRVNTETRMEMFAEGLENVRGAAQVHSPELGRHAMRRTFAGSHVYGTPSERAGARRKNFLSTFLLIFLSRRALRHTRTESHAHALTPQRAHVSPPKKDLCCLPAGTGQCWRECGRSRSRSRSRSRMSRRPLEGTC